MRRHLVFALAIGLAAPACSRNPATGRLQAFLISEDEEIALGQEVDAEVREQMSLYDDPEVVALVQAVGKKIAGSSERPELPWTFAVIDDPAVNAFALPGGHIYVTRGLLAHLRTTDELAAVLGHEVGHVTARHSVVQLRKTNTARRTVGVFRIIDPNLQHIGGIAAGTAGLALLKYSRDDEFQADDLGLRYVERTGYDPKAIPAVFSVLSSITGTEGRVPTWLSTHPEPEVRHARMVERVGAGGQSRADADYLKLIDGIVYGVDPRNGYFTQGRFVLPRLGFAVNVPPGWSAELGNGGRVIAVSPDEKGLWIMGPTDHESHTEALDSFFSSGEIARGQDWSGQIGGFAALSAAFSIPTDSGGVVSGLITFVQYGELVLTMIGVSDGATWSRYSGGVAEATSSFSRAQPQFVGVEPMRVELVTLQQPSTLAAFNEAHPSVIGLDELAVLNRVDPGASLPAGVVLKRVVGFRPATRITPPA